MRKPPVGGVATRLLAPGEEGRWEAFVQARPQATLSHRSGWKAVVESAYGKRCFCLVAHRDDVWKGLLPLVHMRGRLAGNRLVSMPFLDQGGILSESAEVAAALRRAACGLAARLGATGLDLRGSVPAEPPEPAAADGLSASGDPAVASERFRLVLPLGSSRDDLWQAIGGKVRNQVRKSEKEDLVTRRADRGALGRFYQVFAANMRDLGSPVHSRRFFAAIFDTFGEGARLYLTVDGRGCPVAGGVALRFADTVVVPWASALRSARSACPNHSLYWRILCDALEEGARFFDFGRSSEGSGTFHFKRQWGAEPLPLEWSFYDLDGRRCEEGYLSARGNPHLVELWRRLPLGVANRLGPVLRGRLPH